MPDAFNPVAVTFIVSAGVAALLASGVLSVLVGLPARAWQRWRGLRAGAAAVPSSPLRPDLAPPMAAFATQTRSLLQALSDARGRVGGWNDGERPGLLARCLGLRSDDDYHPTIEMFGEVSRWLLQATALSHDDSPEAPALRLACARVRGLVVARDPLARRIEGLVAAIGQLDLWLSVCGASPYRDRHCPEVARPRPSNAEDEEATRARILARHEAVVHRVAARYADDPTGREDLRQEIRLAVWLALPRHRGEASLATYVRRIAHYCGARFARRQPEVEQVDEPADRSPDPVERLHDAEQREALREALGALPHRQREALELLLSGLSYQEIAQRLGITESNASVRITRARQRLRRQLAPVFA